MKLSKKSLLVVSVMLFALFFGAGNLIFPPFLGQNAGENTLPAMVGFLATAVVLPVLGVVVVARFDGLEKLGKQVGARFALVFTVLIYLSIGPGLGIPRAASVPFEMAVAPYLPEGSNPALWMAAYSLGFFLIALWLCLNPGKLVDRIGRGLTPALLALLTLLFISFLFREVFSENPKIPRTCAPNRQIRVHFLLRSSKNFQGCFTVRLSRFFVVSGYRCNFYRISCFQSLVNTFFYFFVIHFILNQRLFTAHGLYYHIVQAMSTAFLFFFQI